MTLTRSNPRAKPRWIFLIFIVAGLVMALASSSLAVHDDNRFELDKNVSNDTNITRLGELGQSATVGATTLNVCQATADPATPFLIQLEAERMTVTAIANGSFGGNCGAATKKTYTVTRAADDTTATAHAKGGVDGIISLYVPAVSKPGTDWNQVHAALQSDPGTNCASLGLVACTFVSDQIGPTTFIGGASKDHLPVSGWSHTSGASPDKAEIINAYAAKAIDTDTADQLLYFGMDRYAVDGSTDIGFWFFKGEVTANADGTFSGDQQVGDILALGTFTQGGATSNIRVFRWVGTGGNESGTIQGPDATFGDCVPGAANDDGCATVNDTSVPVPWTYSFKGSAKSGWVPAGGGFEGGIDLTALGLDGCFSSFLAETRSSPEITAILKDFALGSFESCETELTTTPSDSEGDALTDTNDNDVPDISIGTGSATVTDSADLDVKGISEWDGTLSFYLCGPTAGIETCDDTGTLVSSHAVDETSASPFVSDTATVTSVGEYCWGAFFDSDTQGVPDAEDTSSGECFEVLPVDPSISTNASTGPVEVGGSIDDTATLGGTASQPGDPIIDGPLGAAADGTITFTAYGPHADTTTCTTVAYTSVVNVSGNGDYTASSGTGGTFTPVAAGIYNWVASYSGDSPNTNSVSGSCGDANETSEIEPVDPTISTNATAGPVPLGSSIDDTATLGGTAPQPDGDPAEGTITFTAYGPHADTTTCTTVAYTSVVNVSGDGNYTASDGTGGTFTPTAAGTYNWIAVYSGDAPNTNGVSGSCGDANEASVVISLQPDVATEQSFLPNDEATITVVSGGGALEGSVDFALYDNASCTGTALYSESDVALSVDGTGLSGTAATSNTTFAITSTTHVWWSVTFDSTNPAHKDASSVCVEDTSLTIDNTTPEAP